MCTDLGHPIGDATETIIHKRGLPSCFTVFVSPLTPVSLQGFNSRLDRPWTVTCLPACLWISEEKTAWTVDLRLISLSTLSQAVAMVTTASNSADGTTRRSKTRRSAPSQP